MMSTLSFDLRSGSRAAALVTLVFAIHTGGFVSTASAGDYVQCSDVARGDVAACKAKAKAQCTSSEYWERRGCEHELAVKADKCRNGEYQAACEAARVGDEACSYSFGGGQTYETAFGSEFVKSYNAVGAVARTYGKLHEEWSACYGVPLHEIGGKNLCSSSEAEECIKGPSFYRKHFQTTIDEVLAGDGAYQLDDIERLAKVFLAVNGKLRPELRYREDDLAAYAKKGKEAVAKAEAKERAAADAKVAALRATYRKAGIKGKRLELFVAAGHPPEDSVFKAIGCDRFVSSLKELKRAKKLFQWFEGDNHYTVRKITFRGDNYTVTERTFRRPEAAYAWCR